LSRHGTADADVNDAVGHAASNSLALFIVPGI